MNENVKVWFSNEYAGVLQELMLQVAFISTGGFAFSQCQPKANELHGVYNLP